MVPENMALGTTLTFHGIFMSSHPKLHMYGMRGLLRRIVGCFYMGGLGHYVMV